MKNYLTDIIFFTGFIAFVALTLFGTYALFTFVTSNFAHLAAQF